MQRFLQKLEVPHPPYEPRPTALINHDVKPIEKGRRVWTWTAFFALWATTSFNMSNFQAGSSMLSIGLSWWQAFITLFVGHVLTALLIMITSFPGLYYYISFPVATRFAWGFWGSIFVVLNRITLSIVWSGVQSWQGGLMMYVCLRALWPSIDNIPNTIPAKTGMTLPQFVGFIVYFVIQLPFVFLSPSRLRYLIYAGSLSGLIVQLVLAIWACATMGSSGFGSIITQESPLPGSQVAWMGVYSISIIISSITAGALSACDYARFAKRPISGMWSQGLGFAPAWLSNILGILTVAATQQRFGAKLWSVVQLLVAMQDADPTSGTRAGVFFAALGFLISQIALNVIANSFAGGTDIASLLPKFVNIRRGQLITVFLGLVINPWYLLSGAIIFVSVMSAYAIFLQPFIGILLAHYFVVQKRRIKVSDLYKLGPSSIYWYAYGVNWRAVVSWVVGVVPHLPGFLATVNPSIKVTTQASQIYYLCSITSFLIAFFLTVVLHMAFPVKAQTEYIASVTFTSARDEVEEYIESYEQQYENIEVRLPPKSISDTP